MQYPAGIYTENLNLLLKGFKYLNSGFRLSEKINSGVRLSKHLKGIGVSNIGIQGLRVSNILI